MEKLKTLKDFEYNELGTNHVPNSEELRQDAIKDIKAIKSLGKTPEDIMWEEIEIIGNIYENAELLEEK